MVAAASFALAGQAMAAPSCGANTGEAATGEPIIVGGIYGKAPPGDFSASTDAAKAYFDCVNENGGINGRPIDYRVENDQWNPEMAAQAASKLVKDAGAVALVANGSFIEIAVNAKTYKEENIMSMAAACAISECFESSNIVSTNQGPLPSNLGAAQFAQEELGSKNVACIGFNIPNNGPWSCQVVIDFMQSRGGDGSMQLLNPGAPDVNSALLEAISTGADTILMNLPAGLAIAVLKAAEEQDLRDSYVWIAPTPLYDLSVPAALRRNAGARFRRAYRLWQNRRRAGRPQGPGGLSGHRGASGMTLELETLSVQSHGRIVVQGISLSVEPGQVTAILGANGAGKSELVLGVAGMLAIAKGTVRLDGVDITGKTPDVIRSLGVAAVPEGHKVLTRLTVDENLRAAGSLLRQGMKQALGDTYALFPELAERKGQNAGTLSGGQQQMLALGHALISRPKYILIDEMSLGLVPLVVKRLMGVVGDLKSRGVGVILIEQFTELALGIADNAMVLRGGKVRFAGLAATLKADATLLDEAYFGRGHQPTTAGGTSP